jgi:hypothetical protein
MARLILGISGGIASCCATWLTASAAGTRWYLWIAAVALLVAVDLGRRLPHANARLVPLLLCLPVALGNFYQATTFSQTQGLAGLRCARWPRPCSFIINIIGLVPARRPSASFLTCSRTTSGGVAAPALPSSLVNVWAAVHYVIAGRHLANDLKSRRVAHRILRGHGRRNAGSFFS